MDILEKKNKYNHLFDYYGCLLTEKQQEYFTSYYFDDMSLAEIADVYNVSRNAVHDQLKKIYSLLDYYEEKLQLSSRDNKLNDILKEYENNSNSDIQELINKLCADEHIPTAFHVKAQLAGNILTCSFTYNAKPELSGSYIFYEQYQSLNYHPITSSRPNNFDNFAINNSNYSYEVSTSDQLFYALERGVKPICVEGSNAEKVYQEMKIPSI